MADIKAMFRSLPGVDKLLEVEAIEKLTKTVPRELVTRAIRDVLDEARASIGKGDIAELIDCEDIAKKAVDRVNHILSPNETSSGKDSKLSILMNILTGAKETIAVDSMANAVHLVLGSLKMSKDKDRERDHYILVPSTHLIHVNGLGYLEEMITAAELKIIEVGCTNRVHLKDLRKELAQSKQLVNSYNIAGILLSDKPNTKTLGFTKELNVAEVAELAREYKIPLIMVHWNGTTNDSSTSIKQYIGNGANLVISPTKFNLGGFEGAIVCGTSDAVLETLYSTVKMPPLLHKQLEDNLYEVLKSQSNKL